MQAIDLGELILKSFPDDKKKITESHLESVCKFQHRSKETCRYITILVDGCYCCKNTDIKKTLDELASPTKSINDQGDTITTKPVFSALGDNCKGL